MTEEVSIEQELASLMSDPTSDPSAVETPATPETEPEKPAGRDEKGKFTKTAKAATVTETPETPETPPAVATEPVPEPPQGLPAYIKAEWAKLSPEMRSAIQRREEDVHKMFTRNDSELNLGRKMKEVISPYMPIIQAEGGTPETVVQSMLNTAYQLRTASPQQKAQLIAGIAQTYGVDLSLLGAQQQDPVQAQMMQLQQLQQQLNPDAIMRQLQEKMEYDKHVSEVKAFAADPANEHFQAVSVEMAALLDSGRAKDLREAYDKAIWANPEIRSMLLAKQEAEKAAKQKSELEAKKKAAASVTGSSGRPASSTATGKPKTIEDALREQWDAIESGL